MEILFIIVGMLIMYTINVLFTSNKPIGSLRIDQSDPNEQPYLFLEISKDDIVGISKKKHITLTVKNENFIPQK